MTSEVRDLVDEVAAETGAAPPEVLGEDAPVISLDEGLSLHDDTEQSLYYVGLIGGKDVGKTSLVNAIAGTVVAQPVGHGEGTRHVLAYCHRDAADDVRRELARIGDRLQVLPHDADHLRHQVLLDLPDIDSKYEDHVDLTRRMLRHMLYPVWVQSVEKYADARPRQLLLQVAAGNDPENFLFVLSKVDHVIDHEGLDAAGELAEDYGTRLRRALKLTASPEVLLCSAKRPEEYDLPRLRKMLGVERSDQQVEADKGKAQRRQILSIADWVGSQDLAGRAEAAGRLADEAAELLAERAGAPVLEQALPRLEEDAGHRMALAEPAAKAQCRAWPVVGWIDVALAPIVALVRRNLSAADSEAASLERHLADAGQSTAKNVQASFAQLQAAYPAVGRAYERRRLWEAPEAEAAAASLRRKLDAALATQRRQVAERMTPRRIFSPLRWLATVGVAVWFVLVQPLLQIVLPEREWSWTELATEAVALLSAQQLLASLGLVAVYLLVLWAGVRTRAYRKVATWRRRLSRGDAEDAQASPAAQTLAWMDELLAPLQDRHAKLRKLAGRADALRRRAA
jgi:hypothetical protein